MFSVKLDALGNQIEMTGRGVIGSDVLVAGKRPASRYWWKTSALGDALSGSPRPAPFESSTMAWWSGTLSGEPELPSPPNASCVMFLISVKSGRLAPCEGIVDLNALSTLARSARCL